MAAYKQLKAASQPADRILIADLIARLSRHFGAQRMTPAEAATVVEDFMEDFREVPGWLLVQACKKWRNKPQNDYRPTPGKLRAMIREELTDHRAVLEGLRRIAGAETV